MWEPEQHLSDEAQAALRDCGNSEMIIQFLGWMSGYASAISNSKNPCKAAKTILQKEKTLKMLDIFEKKKKDYVAPKVENDPGVEDEIRRRLGKLEDRETQSREESKPRKRAAGAGDEE